MLRERTDDTNTHGSRINDTGAFARLNDDEARAFVQCNQVTVDGCRRTGSRSSSLP